MEDGERVSLRFVGKMWCKIYRAWNMESQCTENWRRKFLRTKYWRTEEWREHLFRKMKSWRTENRRREEMHEPAHGRTA